MYIVLPVYLSAFPSFLLLIKIFSDFVLLIS